MANPYEKAARQVANFQDASNLLAFSDGHPDNVQLLLLWALGELRKEVLPEVEKEGTVNYQHSAYSGEMHDVYVLVSSKLLSIKRIKDVQFDVVHSANGIGKQSYIYEKIDELLCNLIDDPSRKGFEQFLKLFYSALKYSPGGGQFLETFANTVDKISKNRPDFLYNTFCPILQRELNEEECMLKYAHLEKMTRLLRKYLGRDLEFSDCSRDSRPDIFWLMVDWIQTDWALAQLKGIFKAEKNGVAIGEQGIGAEANQIVSVILRPSKQEVVQFTRNKQ
ncbi:MAG: hypothetical protein WAU07_04160 [Microgenomates group bacterium]